ncbi:hypothetical protein PAXINDRAFT_106590 [Paxillus involutus ATCC 200175]|nr:hypothetical protein PAXINDRAFT_106590 [Paxillus involutus ATCC 200175]
MGTPVMPYGPLHEDYGPSPSDAGALTSSNAPPMRPHAQAKGGPNPPPNSKQYSFVALPGNAVKKRPRRRYDEIERLYRCSWPGCAETYGTLNHLNAHVTMRKHGSKRSPNEFKELRKQWRKAKKEEAEVRSLSATRHGSQDPAQHHIPLEPMSDAVYQSYHLRSHLDSAYPGVVGFATNPSAPAQGQTRAGQAQAQILHSAVYAPEDTPSEDSLSTEYESGNETTESDAAVESSQTCSSSPSQ